MAEPKIKILNVKSKKHSNHPINKCIKQINDFCNHTFMRVNALRGNKMIQFDSHMIQVLAKQLNIILPKQFSHLDQNLYKSKQFIIHCKEMMLKKLYHTINFSNEMHKLHFERQNFQFYKCFVGKGNNG